jgi:hypothetical protein
MKNPMLTMNPNKGIFWKKVTYGFISRRVENLKQEMIEIYSIMVAHRNHTATAITVDPFFATRGTMYPLYATLV